MGIGTSSILNEDTSGLFLFHVEYIHFFPYSFLVCCFFASGVGGWGKRWGDQSERIRGEKAAILNVFTYRTRVRRQVGTRVRFASFSFGCGFLVSLFFFLKWNRSRDGDIFYLKSSGVDTVYTNWPMDIQIMGREEEGDSTFFPFTFE